MTPQSLLPAIDPAPLPGPVWLFHLLWVLTFVVHLMLVNAVLGGSLLSAVALLRRGAPGRLAVAGFFLRVNTWAISFAITFAIAPLLFFQVLYGRFFYSATILIGWGWLAMLGLLTIAYYLNYLAKRQLARGADPTAAVFVQAVFFLVIAGVQVAVALLHAQPGRWSEAARSGWSILTDPSFAPRYLHFVFAAAALAGGALAWWRMRSGGTGRAAPGGGMIVPESAAGTAGAPATAALTLTADGHFGLVAALTSTAFQIPVGFWLLLALPREVLLGFMRGGAATMVPFGLGVIAGIGALVVLALSLSPLAKPRLIRHAAELMVATSILMIVTRHQVREAYLAPWRMGEVLPVAPQWGVFALFAVLLLVSVAVTTWALVRSAKDRPLPGEPAA